MTEPIKFGAPSQQTEELAKDVVDAAHDVTELAPEAQQAVQEFEHTHESVLTDLMTKLEGIAHLGKSEIVAIVDEARGRFTKL